MSHIGTKFADINKIRFEPFTSKPASVSKVVMVDNVVTAVGVNGTIYTTGVKAHCYYSGGSSRLYSVLRGCAKLGVLSAAVVEQFTSDEMARRAADNQRWAAKNLPAAAKEAGIKLTPTQIARCAALAKDGP